jgi:hypothetical protein
MNDYWDHARKAFEMAGMNQNHRVGMRVCFAIADLLTEITRPRSILITAPLKGEDRQKEKLRDEYNGDMSLMKDLVRTTLLTRDDAAYDSVAKFFKDIEGNKTLLNARIQEYYNRPYYKDGVYRGLSDDERALLLSGAWEVMPGQCKLKDPNKFAGYSDASVVLQNSTRHSVGGAGQDKTPNRPVGPSPARWAVQTLRVEIQANVPDMIYGKQLRETFLSMIPGTFGEDLHASIRNKLQILGGLGHLFYEVIRRGVLVAETEALSKRYYDYIRHPRPGMVCMDLCMDIADYVDKNRQTLKQNNVKHLPGETLPHTTTLSEICCGALPAAVVIKKSHDEPVNLLKGNTRAKAAMFERPKP